MRAWACVFSAGCVALWVFPGDGLKTAVIEPDADEAAATPRPEQDEFLVRVSPEELPLHHVSQRAERRQSEANLLCNSPTRASLSKWFQQCKGCKLHPGARQTFFIYESDDGVGSRILNIIGAMAFADAWNMSFGGVVHRKKCEKAHGQEIIPVVEAFFGLQNPEDLYVALPLPGITATTTSSQSMTQALRSGLYSYADSLYMLAAGEPSWAVNEFGISPQLLSILRDKNTKLQQLHVQHFRPGATNIALHVRRGDVYADEEYTSPGRGTPDGWYIQLMDILKMVLPDAEFHIFSSVEGNRDPAEFDIYRTWGASVHLNTELRETLVHFAQAQVLVTARSSFSYVAALLNTNCVMYQKWYRALDEWTHLPHSKCGPGKHICPYPFNRTQIESCIRRVVPGVGRVPETRVLTGLRLPE